MTHPTWELKIDNDAALVLTPCPGTKDLGLAESVAQLKEQGVVAVVTAINAEEMASKNVADLGEQVQAQGMQCSTFQSKMTAPQLKSSLVNGLLLAQSFTRLLLKVARLQCTAWVVQVVLVF